MLLARRDVEAEFAKTRFHVRIGERLHHRGVEPVNDRLWRALWGVETEPAGHIQAGHAGLHVVALAIGPKRRTQIVRGERLADGADVVFLAFDREQHGALDRRRLDLPVLIGQLPERQRVILEHQLHRLEIELGREIEHGDIFVVELLGGLGFRGLTFGDVLVKLAMRFDMAVHVHRHERRQLHETRIDAAAATGIARRHRGDQLLLEPFHRLAFGKLIDFGRIDAGVDRPGHQSHRARLRRMVAHRHHARGNKRADARLAHRHHMRARSDLLEKLDQVRGVAVETERAVGQRHVARIVPVGNIDVMLGEHRAHRGAQQSREMARQRRDQQNARLLLFDVLLEMPQGGKRRHQSRLFGHRDFAVADHDAVDAVFRPRMGEPDAGDHLIGGGKIAQTRRPRRTVEPRPNRLGRHAGELAHRIHDVRLRLIGLIKHSIPGRPRQAANHRLAGFMLHCEIIIWARLPQK